MKFFSDTWVKNKWMLSKNLKIIYISGIENLIK